MSSKKNISVCIATYNGEKFIREQLISILSQLHPLDEVIVSDDSSTDNTLMIINSFNDLRIKVFQNKLGKGPVKNFENAISKASGDIIFLSDQDDIWNQSKVEKILRVFENNEVTCVFSNAELIDSNGTKTGKVFFERIPNLNIISLILKNQFLGCTMAFRNNADIKILPFNTNLPMHDWYIGIKNVLKGKVKFIDENLIYYRRHGNNVTTGKSAGLLTIIKWRIQILKAIIN